MQTEQQDTQIVVDNEQISVTLEPADVRELRSIVEQIDREGKSALIVGGGTRLGYGNRGGPFDIALSTRKLSGIVDYSPEDLTISVEPGCTIKMLNAALREHRQMLVIDAALPERSTIGGTYASALCGPRRFRYGSLKDAVLGIESVSADGVLTKAGGAVVKNVTGFDLMRLHYGAIGAFGVITKLNLKVVPRPEMQRALVFRIETLAECYWAAIACLRSKRELAAIYIASDSNGYWTLNVVVAGSARSVARQASRLSEIIYEHATPSDAKIVDIEHDGMPNFPAFLTLDGNKSIARISAPATQQFEVLRNLHEHSSLRLCGDLGSGLVYVLGSRAINPKSMTTLESKTSYLSIPTSRKVGLDVFGTLPDALATILMRLKREFDPDLRFNRGRFVLGM